ncbi:hypothetical protein N9N28_14120 [Rubripirellula amarantea]|nr:hypothetical protein [Rubripirellula amarantea]
MQSLSTTYATLSTTRNEAAVEVLASVLSQATDDSVRMMAIRAMQLRPESRAPEAIFENWGLLRDQEKLTLRDNVSWLEKTVLDQLKSAHESTGTAIEIARFLSMTSAVRPLISLAESCNDRETQETATRAILELVAPLGQNARRDHDQQSVRLPIVQRLAESVDTFSVHRNASLVDAFLIASYWGDRELRQIFADQRQSMKLITLRLGKTKHPAVVELLAGYVRRKKIPSQVCELIHERNDVHFRASLLTAIGSEPPMTVIHNLRSITMPKSCVGGAALLDLLPASLHAALVQLYGAACLEPIVTMHVVVKALKLGGPKTGHAAAVALSRCEILDIDYWMRAAVPVADDDLEEIAADPDAQLVKSLIDLLDHKDAAIVRGVRRVLGPMHAEAMLPRMGALRPRSRRRLGRVIMMIDLDAIDRVRDALRHSVLNKRLEAIAMADALGLVDLLTDSFAHISTEDHQEARMLAADVMADASSEETLQLLTDMLELPASPVRDAAEAAVLKRRKVNQRSGTRS